MCKKQKNNNELLPVESFSTSLAFPLDLGYDVLEKTIDLVLDNDVVKQIPIVKSIIAIKDVSVSIYKRHEIKKILSFLQGLNKHAQDPDIIKMKERVLTDSTYLRKEAELALIVLEKTIETEKAPLFANLFYLYVKDKINLNEYKELIMVIHSLYFDDISILQKVSNGNPNNVIKNDLAALNRLESIGVIKNNVIDKMELNYNHYEMTVTGAKLIKIIAIEKER